MIRIVPTAFAVCTTSIVLVGAVILPKTIASRAAITPPMLAGSKQSLHGYYLAKLINEVGNGLPESSFCFRFMSSGTWSNTGSENFNGTYLLTGKELFASAVWLPSPAVFMSLQGSVDAKQGSGEYLTSSDGGQIYGGGVFTMTREHNAGCN